ncbi:hypothetical protein AYI69_g3657 [Smittium culicis]|uniref:PiggyBac transposable element-derived protein domain-containing protein n=1 Tax=Smittium culicis TaxID=133412 RepID=A0A1R1YJ29_9FUNG|nr:hypothetical protein AYI69_g3657 [Smittium culicis]
MDNFFTSVPLMEYLKKIGHYACGTIRPNRRHLPEFSKNNRLRKWDTEWYMNENGISVLKWMDSKPVHMISTYHGPSILSRIPRSNEASQTQNNPNLNSQNYDSDDDFEDEKLYKIRKFP